MYLPLIPFPHPFVFPSPLCLSLIPLPFPHPFAFPSSPCLSLIPLPFPHPSAVNKHSDPPSKS